MFHIEKSLIALLMVFVFGFLILISLFNHAILVFFYNYFSGIILGTSEAKMLVFFTWIMIAYFIGYVSMKRNWKFLNLKNWLIIFFISVIVLYIMNFVVFEFMLAKAGASNISGNPTIFSVSPNLNIYSGYSKIDHTHSFKPVVYELSGTVLERFGFDTGGALANFFNKMFLIPILIFSIVYLVSTVGIVINTAKKELPVLSLFIFGIISYCFFTELFDAGFFGQSTGVAISLIPIFFILINTKNFNWLRFLGIIFLPLFLLGIFNLIGFVLLNEFPIGFEAHFIVSAIALLSATIMSYFYNSGKRKLISLIPIIILIFSLLTFAPYPFISQSVPNGEVYMMFTKSNSTVGNSTFNFLEKISNITGVSNRSVIVNIHKILFVRADIRTNISTTYLSEKVFGRDLTPMKANYLFTFVDPSNVYVFKTYVPASREEIARKNFGPIGVADMNNKIDNITEVAIISPFGLSWKHFSLIFYDRLNVSYIIGVSNSQKLSSNDLKANFITMLIPATSARLKAYEIL